MKALASPLPGLEGWHRLRARRATQSVLVDLVRKTHGAGRTTVVLVEPEPDEGAQRLLAKVRKIDPDLRVLTPPVETVDDALAGCGDIGLTVNLMTGRRHRMIVGVWWHLAAGGTYVEPLAAGAQEPSPRVRWWRQVSRGDRVRGVSPSSLKELRRSVGRVRQEAGLLRVRKRAEHLYLLDETTVTSLLPSRTGVGVETLDVRHGGRRETGRALTHGGTAVPREEQVAPRVALRHYTGPVSLYDGMVVSSGSTVLPETFKWFDHRPLSNGRLVHVGDRHARRRTKVLDPMPLPGSYYYFEYKNSGHYGHLMTEGLAKLWAWEQVRAVDPEVRLLMREHPRDAERVNPRPDLGILAAFGIDESDITWVLDPVEVTSLYSATPMLHNKQPYAIHPDLLEVWDRVRDGLLRQQVGGPPAADRIFVTRRSGNRLCRNYAVVEELFDEYGFTIVRPELLSLGEQAAVFSGASVVAGFGGTGMFNLVHARSQPTVIVLNQESYDARNEDLITGLRGCDLHYFWSAPDRAHPSDGFSYRAFQSEWTFDLGRNEAPLRELLAGL